MFLPQENRETVEDCTTPNLQQHRQPQLSPPNVFSSRVHHAVTMIQNRLLILSLHEEIYYFRINREQTVETET